MKKIILCLCLFVLGISSVYAQNLRGVLDARRGQPGISTINSLVARSVDSTTDRDLGAGSYAIYKGSSALIIASTLGYSDVVRALLDSRASVNTKDSRGYTALFRAANREVADMLIRNNANINDKNNFGFTPLMYSASVGRSDVAKVLIDNKAQVNNVEGIWSPLIIASYRNKVDVVNLLVNNGAQVELKNSEGNIAFDYAQTDQMKDVLYKYAFEKSKPASTPVVEEEPERQITIIEDDPVVDPKARKSGAKAVKEPKAPAAKKPAATKTPAKKPAARAPAKKPATAKAPARRTTADASLFFENYEDGYLDDFYKDDNASRQVKASVVIPSME